MGMLLAWTAPIETCATEQARPAFEDSGSSDGPSGGSSNELSTTEMISG